VWPPFSLAALRDRSTDLPEFPFADAGTRIYSKARHGLWHGVRALGLVPGDEILAPAYHQGAEIEAFVRAGLTCRFYRLDDRLAPLESDLDRLFSERVKALHVIHYWGFPQGSLRWRSWCDDRGLAFVEDGAQALLASSEGTSAGAHADLAVYCLYKSFGLPDGAAVYCRRELPQTTGIRPLGLRAFGRRLGSALTARSVGLARLRSRLIAETEDLRIRGAYSEGEFELGDPYGPPSQLTRLLYGRVIDRRAADSRRTNYGFLLDRLEASVPSPFRELVEGAVPIGFPVTVADADESARVLRGKLIMPGVFWPTSHPSLGSGPWELADHFRRRVLALPVHQELRHPDLERIAKVAATQARPRDR
jgi:hypothetical protein